jgi:glycolate oxidase
LGDSIHEAIGMLRERLVEALGSAAVLTEPEDLAVYAFDAYTAGGVPAAVALPGSTREVAAVVKIANDCGQPIVARGAGTGLCGGAVPLEGLSRMNRVLEIDVPNRRARVAPGLINLELSHAVRPHGLFYAPDPASQKTSTIGGNIATNAGGPHCLSYGTTVNHVLGLEIVDSNGEVYTTSVDDSGYDLTAVLTGSEGTLGIVTSAWVRLQRLPEATGVWVAAFADIDAASEAVSAIIAAGIVPSALEMMDRVIAEAVEAAFHAGYPTEAAAVLLIEQYGCPGDIAACEATIAAIAKAHDAVSWRAGRTQAERDALWAGRKGAVGATGRIAPNYYTQDVCVPRSKLPPALRTVEQTARDCGLIIGNVFHAGDGNLHPLILYDGRNRRQAAAVVEGGNAILQAAIDLGGTISGEHGVGYEKRGAMTKVYTPDDLATMGRVREVFDPRRSLNPEKIFPAGTSCPETRPPSAC